jgi:hypothetical protein
MTHSIHKTTLKDELWNVSLFPTVKAAAGPTPPHAPNPSGGRALQAPALLSVSEAVSPEHWRQAA